MSHSTIHQEAKLLQLLSLRDILIRRIKAAEGNLTLLSMLEMEKLELNKQLPEIERI